MGAGNVCTFGDYEGLFYLDKDFITLYSMVERCHCGSTLGFESDEEPRTAAELYKAGIAYDFNGQYVDWHYHDYCRV